MLTRHLPESMVPNSFVVLDRMPLTPNGKVDRRALARRDRVMDQRSAAYVAPASALEQRIAAIWGAMLGVDCIGAHDDFFEFGGHSLLATQVVARVRAAFDVDIALRTVFQHRTVAGFAAEVERLISERISLMTDEDAERLLRKEAMQRDEQSTHSFAR